MRPLALALAAVLVPSIAAAQPAQPSATPTTAPAPAPATPPPDAPALATPRSDRELAAALATIVQDPTVPVNDPKVRALAQGLMTEGVKQLNARHFEQALANFLDAYAKFPSPRILLDIGSTLRDMGRVADAANTYDRYLLDPGSGAERVAEVKQLLDALDATLTILTVHVTPHGSELSIDGGPFLAVGSTLVTRVRTGIHLVRIRNGARTAELSLNGFEGENKEVAATLPDVAPTPVAVTPTATPPATPTPTATPAPTPAPTPSSPPAPPERVDAWLSTGTSYASSGGNDRRVRSGIANEEILPIIPDYSMYTSNGELIQPVEHIASGALAMLRIDGRGRGVAAGLGVALSPRDHLEVELAVLRSEQWGVYAGARYRFLVHQIRPYIGVGVPVFAYDDDREPDDPTRIAYGIRAAAGIEIEISAHLSVQGDVGFERFFHLGDTSFDASLVVPTVGVVGRL